jgi:hypothetical protein
MRSRRWSQTLEVGLGESAVTSECLCTDRELLAIGGRLHRSPFLDSLFSYDIHSDAEHSENEKIKGAFKEAAKQVSRNPATLPDCSNHGTFILN